MSNIYDLTYDGYCYHVVAASRGKARQTFIAYWMGEAEWTDPMSIRVLAKNVDMPDGVDEQCVWARKNHVSLYFYDFLDEFVDIACQECGHLLWEDESGVAFCPDCK